LRLDQLERTNADSGGRKRRDLAAAGPPSP
jgi:hypothetical protein